MSKPTLRVTRYDAYGKLFHTCITSEVHIITENGRIFVDMPMRFWAMVDGGRIEIEVIG